MSTRFSGRCAFFRRIAIHLSDLDRAAREPGAAKHGDDDGRSVDDRPKARHRAKPANPSVEALRATPDYIASLDFARSTLDSE
jgi:hypothetical protein